MSDAPTAQPAAVEPSGQGFLVRFLGVLTSPRATFVGVAQRPRWFGMVAALVVVGIVAGTVLMSTDVGRLAALDAARGQLKAFGVNLPPEAEAKMERDIMETPLWRLALQTSIGQMIAGAVMPLVVAGIFFLVFNVMMGGDATFKQVFATIVHANPVMLVGVLFTTPLNYLRGSMTGATNLAVFLPMLDETSFLAKLLGSVDLIRVWWVVILATGLGVLYKRKTGPIATALFVVYGIIAVIFAAVTAGRAGA
ncbi:MAG: YIP1 family protein [Acidobacteriota bacterium]